MVKSAGYTIICRTKKDIFALTSKTLKWRHIDYEAQRKNVFDKTYWKVTDASLIEQIKFRSERWDLVKTSENNRYYIFIQYDKNKNNTGNIRIVKKDNAISYGIFNEKVKAKEDSYYIYYSRNYNKGDTP